MAFLPHRDLSRLEPLARVCPAFIAVVCKLRLPETNFVAVLALEQSSSARQGAGSNAQEQLKQDTRG
jgi:hypothetical protein